MPVSPRQYAYIIENSFLISRLFIVHEQRDFLLQFLSNKQLNKFLESGETNFGHAEKLISFMHYKKHEQFYDAFVNQLVKIHKENSRFITGLVTTSDGDLKNPTDETMIITKENKINSGSWTGDCSLMMSMKEILCDMRRMCDERQDLQLSKDDQLEIKIIENIREKTAEEIRELKAEISHLNSEWSQSLDKITQLELKISEMITFQDSKIEQQIEVVEVKSQRQLNPGDTFKAAASLNRKGDFFSNQKKHKKALDSYNRALQMYCRLHHGDHDDIAAVLNNIGIVNANENKIKEALDYYNQALQMRQRLLNSCHESIPGILNNIGDVYYNQNEFNEALKYFSQNLEVCRQLYSVDHDDIASALNWIGVVHGKMNKQKDALNYYNEALAMRQRLHKGDFVGIATVLYNIGVVYTVQNNYTEALQYYIQALRMRQRLHSGDHSETARLLTTIGFVFLNQMKLKEALKFFTQALQMQQHLHVGDHVAISDLLNNIAMIYELEKEWMKSLNYFMRCQQMLQRLFPNGDNDAVKEAQYNVNRIKHNITSNRK